MGIRCWFMQFWSFWAIRAVWNRIKRRCGTRRTYGSLSGEVFQRLWQRVSRKAEVWAKAWQTHRRKWPTRFAISILSTYISTMQDSKPLGECICAQIRLRLASSAHSSSRGGRHNGPASLLLRSFWLAHHASLVFISNMSSKLPKDEHQWCPGAFTYSRWLRSMLQTVTAQEWKAPWWITS